MGASTSEVKICNRALGHLKQDAISSIESPTTPPEVICARTYDDVRRALLRSHIWNFAIKRDTLTPDATAPLFGWENAYNVPNDFIRLLSIGDDSVSDIRNNFEFENGQILGSDLSTATTSTINIRYIYDITTVGKFDALFIEVLALKLALKMAPAFSVSSALINNIKDQLKEEFPMGAAVDGQERPPKRIQKSRLVNARRHRPLSAGIYTIFD